MKPKLLLLSFALVACISSSASATVQELDELRWGEHTYYIYQSPIYSLWYDGPGKPPEGMTRQPDFEWTTTANRKGYSPVWEIRDQKLLLHSIKGRIAGKDVENQVILPGRKFPLVATWYSGQIHLPIGVLNPNTRAYDAVIVFDIDKGNVKSMNFFPAARPKATRNGR